MCVQSRFVLCCPVVAAPLRPRRSSPTDSTHSTGTRCFEQDHSTTQLSCPYQRRPHPTPIHRPVHTRPAAAHSVSAASAAPCRPAEVLLAPAAAVAAAVAVSQLRAAAAQRVCDIQLHPPCRLRRSVQLDQPAISAATGRRAPPLPISNDILLLVTAQQALPMYLRR